MKKEIRSRKKKSLEKRKHNSFFRKLIGKRAISSVIVVLIMALLIIVSIGVIWVTIGTIIRDGTQRVELGQKCLSTEINYVSLNSFESSYRLTLSRKDSGENLGGIKIVLLNGTHSTEIMDPEEFRGMGSLQTKTASIETDLISVTEIHWTPYFFSFSDRELVCEKTNVKEVEILFRSSESPEEILSDKIFISNCDDLQNMNKDLSKHYILINDIDCSDTRSWNDGQGFEPIGSLDNPFLGAFEGKGFIISNLHINLSLSPGTLPLPDLYRGGGLFDTLGFGSRIDSVGLVDVEIISINHVGGLVGTNQGTISNCFVKGNIQGHNYVGGLVGTNHGTISDSYTVTNIILENITSGDYFALGGIASENIVYSPGSSPPSISNSFFAGNISYSLTDNLYWGGAVGFNQNASFLSNLSWHLSETNPPHCYYTFSPDSGIHISNENCIIVQKSENPEYFFNKNNLPLTLWNFEQTWFEKSNDYPVLRKSSIFNCTQLQNIKDDLTNSYILNRDIDCSDTVNWNNGQGFEPIGNLTHPFSGSLDGNGYTIYNLYINRSNSGSAVGLFGTFSSGGEGSTIKNIILQDVNIKGNTFVGGLVGGSHGTISNCSVSGNIKGNDVVGGLVGTNSLGGKIKNSRNLGGTVNGTNHVGGLVGSSGGGNIEFSYSEAGGLVYGEINVGGLVGSSDWGILNSYSKKDVYGEINVGGLVGKHRPYNFYFGGGIINCYATGNIYGNDSVGGLVGFYDGYSSGLIFNSYAVNNITIYPSDRLEGISGGLVGLKEGGTINSSYWYNHSGNPNECYFQGNDGCEIISVGQQPPYFYTITNSPMSEWDFENIWNPINNGTNYPSLR